MGVAAVEIVDVRDEEDDDDDDNVGNDATLLLPPSVDKDDQR